MFCPKCGNQIPDDAKFCGVCGSPISPENGAPDTSQPENTTPINDGIVQPDSSQSNTENNAAQQNVFQPQPNNNAAQPYSYAPLPNDGNSSSDGSKSKKTTIIIVGAVAAVVLILIIFICTSLLGGGYKKPIKELVNYLNKRSVSTEYFNLNNWGKASAEYEMLYSQILMKSYDDDYDIEDWEDRVAEHMDDIYDDFDDEYGYDWEVSYEIKSADKLRDSKLDDLQDDWDSYIEDCEETLERLEDDDDDISEKDLRKLEKIIDKMGKKKITAGYKLKTKLIIEGDEDDEKMSGTLYVVKIGGDWVLYNGILDALD